MSKIDLSKIMNSLNQAMEIAPVGTSDHIDDITKQRRELPLELLLMNVQSSVDNAEKFYLESERRIEEAFKESQKDQSIGRILQFIQLSIMFLSAAKAIHDTLSLVPKIEKTAEESKAPVERRASSTVIPDDNDYTKITSREQEVVKPVLGEWSASDTVPEKHARIKKLVLASQLTDMTEFDPKSNDLNISEQYIEEAMAIYSTLTPTEADSFFSKNKVTLGKELMSAALPVDLTNKDGKIRVKFKPSNTILSFLKSTVKSQSVADSTIFGESARRQLFRHINSESLRIFKWRIEMLGLNSNSLTNRLRDIEETLKSLDKPHIHPLP